jgi:hypothetical protein
MNNKNNPRIDDYSKSKPLVEVMQSINERFNSKLFEGRENGRLINHNLEYGLGAENILRGLFEETLPSKYGVGKGKIVNSEGILSSHQDVIIYDKINYPTLFTDENKNLIVPLESVYAVIEVKTKTDSAVLRKAFEGLKTVSDLAQGGEVKSTNDLVDHKPPKLMIFSFQDDRAIKTIKENYCALSSEFPRDWSFSRYSEKSPGHERDNGYHYLVSGVYILGVGGVYAMLNGSVAIGVWKNNTFGMLLSGLLSTFNQIKLGDYHPESYVSWIGAGAREIHER